MGFVDLLWFTSENRGVDITSVITLFGISAYTKALTSFALGFNKKSPRGCQASKFFGTAGGDLRYWLCY